MHPAPGLSDRDGDAAVGTFTGGAKMMNWRQLIGMAFAGLCMAPLVLAARPAAAQTEIKIAVGRDVVHLPLYIANDRKLIEKHARERGLGEVRVSWVTLGGGQALTDALISGNVHYVSAGLSAMLTLWARAQGTPQAVKAAAGLVSVPFYLVSRNPTIRSLKDFSDRDRIAVPAVKVSIQALLLQMAAARAFGDAQYSRLDPLTISMAHADGMTAMLSGGTEITAQFTSIPFQNMLAARSGMNVVLNSHDLFGGHFTSIVVYATTRYRAANPAAYDAFVAALDEAMDILNSDKRAAAETFYRVAGGPGTAEELARYIDDPQVRFATTPTNTHKLYEFMHRVGSIKVKPESWKDLFFENMHDRPGS